MKYFKITYTIYNVDGSVRKTGSICKLLRQRIKRMEYLENLYGSLIEFN